MMSTETKQHTQSTHQEVFQLKCTWIVQESALRLQIQGYEYLASILQIPNQISQLSNEQAFDSEYNVIQFRSLLSPSNPQEKN